MNAVYDKVKEKYGGFIPDTSEDRYRGRRANPTLSYAWPDRSVRWPGRGGDEPVTSRELMVDQFVEGLGRKVVAGAGDPQLSLSSKTSVAVP